MADTRRGESLVFLVLVIVVFGVIWALCPVTIDWGGRRAKTVRCANNLKHLGVALAMYSEAHANAAPSLLGATEYVGIPDVYVCPCTRHAAGALTDVNRWTDYVFVSGKILSASNDVVMVYCPPRNHGGRGGNILFGDGHVEWCADETVWRRLGERPE